MGGQTAITKKEFDAFNKVNANQAVVKKKNKTGGHDVTSIAINNDELELTRAKNIWIDGRALSFADTSQ